MTTAESSSEDEVLPRRNAAARLVPLARDGPASVRVHGLYRLVDLDGRPVSTMASD